jgi:hypothetical protein
MAINRTSLSAQSISENYDVAIQILAARPDVNTALETPVTPNVMVGFYNSSRGVVELYVTSASGLRYIKVL